MNKHKINLEDIEELHLEIGYQCNLRCVMCFQKDYTQKMDKDLWQKKLLPLYPSLKRLIIQGGEPTVIKESKEVVALALQENNNIKFGAMTNGTLFTKYWQDLFVEHGFMVNFSLNAAKKETHESININSNFDLVLKNLKALLELKQSQGSDVEVSISLVIIEQNLHEVSDFIELAKDLGVNKIRFFFDASRLPEDVNKVKKEIDKALGLREKYKDDLKIEGLLKFYEYYCIKKKQENKHKDKKEDVLPICQAPWKNLYVDHYGKVMSCCMANVILGDLNKTDLKELINNKQAVDFREKMAKADYSYCLETCLQNVAPDYGVGVKKMRGYFDKFIYDFKQSPKTALKKAWRKLKQLK